MVVCTLRCYLVCTVTCGIPCFSADQAFLRYVLCLAKGRFDLLHWTSWRRRTIFWSSHCHAIRLPSSR